MRVSLNSANKEGFSISRAFATNILSIWPGQLAQLVERHPYKVDVIGSNPILPTIYFQAGLSPDRGGSIICLVLAANLNPM